VWRKAFAPGGLQGIEVLTDRMVDSVVRSRLAKTSA
jgi:hypothetical protein